MRVCFVQPNKMINRGSFIDYQIRSLKPELELYNGWYPTRNSKDGEFMNFPYNQVLLRGIIKKIFPKIFHQKYSKALCKNLLHHKIDAVFVEYGPTGANITEALIRANIPFIVHFHGVDAFHYATLKKYKSLYRKMFVVSKWIVVVSEDMIEQIVSLGADRNKVILNPCGVDSEIFIGAKPETAPPSFISIGRFTAKKSPQNTIQAFNIVHNSIKEAKLYMIGNGELLMKCKRLVKILGLNDSVIFLGILKHEEIVSHLKASRVFVLHSIQSETGDTEGLPVSILEASSTGLPVVSTYHAGIKEAVIHNKTGFLVKEGDYQLMGEYMLSLMQNPILAGEMGRAGREYVSIKYNLTTQIENLRQLIENIF
jgi:colanic acid/amylovoran biosynthesis glycosyltransferase